MQKIFILQKIVVILAFLSIFLFTAGEARAALTQSDFWFRDDDGTESSATGLGSGDYAQNTAVTNVAGGTRFRLRFGVKDTVANGSISPRIEFKQGSDCTTGTWTVITSSSNNFFLELIKPK